MGKVVAIDNLGRLVIAQGEKQLSFSSGEVTKVYQLKTYSVVQFVWNNVKIIAINHSTEHVS